MRYSFGNPTSNQAVGNVDRELRRLQKEAERLGALRRNGMLSPAQEAAARRRFTGIFRTLLEDALSS